MFGAQKPDNRRKKRENDHDRYHVMNFLADVGNRTAEEISAQDHGADPENSTEDVAAQVLRVRHPGRPGDWRAKRTHNGDKARENNCSATILFIELVGALQVTTPKKEGVLALVQCRTGASSYPVTHLVATNRAQNSGAEQPFQGEESPGGEDACGYEQRITRKKETREQAGFYKNDGADKSGAPRLNQLPESGGLV